MEEDAEGGVEGGVEGEVVVVGGTGALQGLRWVLDQYIQREQRVEGPAQILPFQPAVSTTPQTTAVAQTTSRLLRPSSLRPLR
jgi:hypothetical protein